MNFSGRGVHFGLTLFDIMNRGFKKKYPCESSDERKYF